MTDKITRLNTAYKKAAAHVLLSEFPAIGPIEVSSLLIDASLRTGRVWVRTTPENLAYLRTHKPQFQAALKKYIKTRYLPSFEILAETGELDTIENLLAQVSHED